jgi:hypothetical protein
MGMTTHMYALAVQKKALFSLLTVLLFAVFPGRAQMATGAEHETTGQTTFATPEAALQALVTAAQDKDRAALGKIFGPDYDKLLSGDKVQDDNELEEFVADSQAAAKLEKVNDTTVTLVIGAEPWPFPIPIVKAANGWRFDTAAGMEAFLDRRVGENELSAIAVCRAYVLAQWEYYTETTHTTQDGLAVYAQRFISTPGKRDGLYWDTAEGEEPSPLGVLVAQARAEGYRAGRKKTRTDESKATPKRRRRPYHGYYFKILKAQGPHAPGGRFNYVINGNMIAGYALIAYPAKWGSSGVMTFIVNQQGRVYQKNLGPKTTKLAAAITEYDPDPSWKLVEED